MRATDEAPAPEAVARVAAAKKATLQGGVLFGFAMLIILIGWAEHAHNLIYFGMAAGMVATGRVPFSELAKLSPWGKDG